MDYGLLIRSQYKAGDDMVAAFEDCMANWHEAVQDETQLPQLVGFKCGGYFR